MHRGKCVVPIRVVVLLAVDEEILVVSKISRKNPKIKILEISEIFVFFQKNIVEKHFFDLVGHIKTWIPGLVGVSLQCIKTVV